MPLDAASLYARLADFYNLLPDAERDALSGVWQSVFERVSDLRQMSRSIDLAKGVFSVPVTVRSLHVPLVFDATNALTEARGGFPFGYSTQEDIVEIPSLQAGFADDADVLTDGADYTVELGKIFFAVEPPSFLVAPTLERNMELIRRNFGILIDFFLENSENYKRRTGGIWAALFGGSTLENIELGMSAVIDVPFTSGGVVRSIEVQGDGSVEVTIGEDTITVPEALADRITVVEGQTIDGYRPITSAVTVEDFKSDPDFATRFGVDPILKFFTFAVTIEAGVVVDLIGPLGSLQDFFSGSVQFIERAKPSYTDFFLSVMEEFEDEVIEIVTESTPRTVELDLPSTVDANVVNQHYGLDGHDIGMGSLTEEVYESQGDPNLDLDSDSIYWADGLEIEDMPSGGNPAEEFPSQGYV
jgi:hypothetical protein